MKRILRTVFLMFLLLASGLLLGLGAIVWLALEDLPDIEALKHYQPPQSTMVFDRNGVVVGRFFDERRTVISLKKLPEQVKLAFIAAEDGDFFEHRGIDYFGLMRAVMLEIKHRTIGGRRVGGSTITQQTARTMLLSSSQTYVRKIKEIVLAQRIENALSKEEILHLYLNQIYFGNGAYVIEVAAQTYFLKPASKLTLFEAAALASIPKSPNRINPFSDAERLRQRQHYVLDQMVKHQFIEPQVAEAAKAAPLFSEVADGGSQALAAYFLRAVKVELLPKISDEVIRRGGVKVYSTLDIKMQKAAEVAMTVGLRTLDKRSGYRGPLFRSKPDDQKKLDHKLDAFKKRAFIADNTDKIWDLGKLTKDILSGDENQGIDNIRLTQFISDKIVGARVLGVNDRAGTASIDLGSKTATLPFSHMTWAHPIGNGGKKLPLNKVSDVLKSGDIILVKLHDQHKQITVSLEQEPAINGGLVALDVKTGGVLAWVGGYDYERYPFDRVWQAKRQPGSGIKPFIYALALDGQQFTASSLLTDAPKAFLDPGTNEFWRPRNVTHKYLGDITFRRCLRSSINTCTITLLEKIGLDAFLQFAKAVDLNSAQTPYPRNLTLALGSGENYPIDFANAMRIFPNLGTYSGYHLIDNIKHASGERENMFEATEKQVLKPETAFIITNILKEVISDSKHGTYLNDVSADLAGKTGTTNNARSTWFTGYSPEVLALVYVGYDDNRSIGADAYGINTAFPIWAHFMNAVKANREPLRFAVPDQIEWRLVDRDNGHAVSAFPDQEMPTNAVMEAFIPGTAPAINADANMRRVAPDSMDEAAFAP